MRWFDTGQNAVMQALDYGPAHLPDGLFAGSPERVLTGMKVHANTISHARLVALEETYPRTRDHLGHDRFNYYSRLFLEQQGVTARPLAEIGAGFDAFLSGTPDAAGAADLARFEWLWLGAYNAADAEPLELGALAGLPPEAMLAIRLVRHPAAAAARFDPLVRALISAEVPGLADAEAIIITRPQADVLICPASTVMTQLLQITQMPITIGNLLGHTSEPVHDEAEQVDAAMQSLVALINAGAFVTA